MGLTTKKASLASIGVLALMASTTAPTSTAKSLVSTSVSITAAINQPGPYLRYSDHAGALGSASSTNPRQTMTVQHRRRGSHTPWQNLKSCGCRWIYFDAFYTQEYRSVLSKRGSSPRVNSRVKTYPWQPTFEDDFNHGMSRKWGIRDNFHYTNHTRSKGDLRACTHPAGELRMVIKRDPQDPNVYLTCNLSTQHTFDQVYGWFAARLKFARYPGAHQSFWMEPTNGYVPSNSEIDVAEYFGDWNPTRPGGTSVTHNVYYGCGPYRCARDHALTGDRSLFRNQTEKWWNSYHVYSVHRTPAANEFYVDQHHVATLVRGPSNTPNILDLSMVVADYELPDMDRVRDQGKLPYMQMSVDWVKAWSE